MAGAAHFIATERTDGHDRLVEAEEPLAGLQLRSGGELPGIIATPALLELVRKSRVYGLRLARAIQAQDDSEAITAWVEIEPDAAGGGCSIGLANWQAAPIAVEARAATEERRAEIERQVAELTARLGPDQRIIAVDCDCPDLSEVAERMRAGQGQLWTDLVEVEGHAVDEPLHWRLLDGARLAIAGSRRHWKAVLLPLGRPEPGSAGFDLLFVADEPPAEPALVRRKTVFSAAMGREIAPVLRQPISRIIANAETIRTQLAGPLAEEYSKYAADIATAGEHLLALIDDLADLEVVEADDFDTAPDTIRGQLAGPLSEEYSKYAADIATAGEHLVALIGDLVDLEAVEAEDLDTAIERVDLAELAHRAAAVLGSRAEQRGIAIELPGEDEQMFAVGEGRRVLQILLNVLGNALRYAPDRSQVWMRLEQAGELARVTVADQGEGLTGDQQAKMFDKFERLGRSDDGGSGLGLYISRRLARAMNGDLTVDSTPGEGARFTLELPVSR